MSLTKIKSSNITTTGVTAGSYTAADITVNSSGQVTSASSGTGGGGATVTILSVIVTSDTYANLDDTAVDISGGYIKIIGTGFASGCTVLVNNIPATSTTFIGPTEVRAQLPATAAGTYVLYVVNANGSVAIRVNGITFSATPSWINSSDLSSHPLNEAISIQLSATSATTYALQSGSSLPAGLTLSSSGLLSGTVTGLENDTSYSFAVIATDAELQDSPRTFTITIVVQVQVSRSLRFNAPDTTYLSRTFPTAGNRRLWTFSAWYKRSNLTDTTNGLFQYGPDGNNQFRLHLDSSGTIIIMDRISAVYIVSMTTTAVFRDPGAWYHIVVAYDTAQTTAADRVKLYINGTQITSFSTPTYPSQNAEGNVCSASTAYIGRGDTTSVYYYSGYLTEVQLVDGQALTPTAFALTNSTTGQYGPKKYMGSYGTNGFYLPFTDNSSVLNLGRNYEPLAADPLWPQTVLLLNGTGTNNANNNTFIDSSTNNFTITRNGNTTQGRFSPFTQGGWSFGGATGSSDYLQIGNSSALQLGTSDFTIECWAFFTTVGTANGSENVLFDFRPTSTSGAYPSLGLTNQTIVYETNSIAAITSSTVALHQWHHIALVRNASNTRLYINGIQSGSTYSDSSNYSCGSNNRIGNLSFFSGGNRQFNGYISNFRIVKGTAVYSGTSTTTPNFTLPTTSLTAIPGTTLLTLQSNRWIDNSPSALAITVNGSPKIQPFSPFTPTTAYSAAANGGSGYFDGSGDYLTADNLNIGNFGTDDFTIECWFYANDLANYRSIAESRTSNGTTTGWALAYDASGTIYFYSNAFIVTSGTGAVILKQWNHVAVTRQSGTNRLFLNGALIQSSATSRNYTDNNFKIATRYDNAGEYFNGYISSFRVVKGTAVYTAAFTPPTAPVTAIANTSLLVNFTNAGIVDATGDNNIETVGDAKISTAQSKWGGSSMAFDGTGDYLYSPSNNLYSFGTGDFTIEAWIYATTLTSKGVFQTSDNPGGLKTTYTSGLVLSTADAANGQLVLNVLGTNITTGSTYIAINTWYHVAITRLAGNISIFLNGVLAGGPTSIASAINGSYLSVGGYYNTSYLWNGYISDFRITRGARYTGTFTPPTAQFAYNQSDIGYKQWVPTNFSVTAGAGNDSVVDTPTNWGVDTGLGGEVRGNYCTWNLLEPSIGTRTIANGALDVTNSGNGSTYSNFGMSTGKWYFECTLTAQSGATGSCYVGLTASTSSKSINNAQSLNPGVGYCMDGTKGIDGTPTSYGATYAVNDIIGCAVDIDAGSVTFYKNGVSQGTITKTLLGQGTGSWIIYTVAAAGAASNSWTLNAGQRPFAYSAPSGFKSLNTHNLPALAVVKSNTAFETVLYTGNGSTQTIGGLNFAPDLVWIKDRSSSVVGHRLYDTIRGATKEIYTHATNAETTDAAGLTAFTTNGFTTGNSAGTNTNGDNLVAWAWDAGTTTVVNTAGTITANVRVNTAAGFSIARYTGTGSSASFGHGLSVAPKLVIIKSLGIEDWFTYVGGILGGSPPNYVKLNTTAAAGTSSGIFPSLATSSVVNIGSGSGVNANGVTHIAYSFAEVPGFSAFGSYTGNGSADGPFVYTGFRPAWIMIKRSDGIENWNLYDNKRNSYNVADLELYPNLSNTEGTSADRDFLSNGFKIRSTNIGRNASGSTYIYAAFAEQPFKYSRAR